MDRATHNLLGAASGLGLGLALGWPWWQTLASAGLASITSDGPTSPDADQFGWWKRIDRWVPDELLGKGGPMRHRGLSHFWGLPVLAALFVYFRIDPHWQWIGWGLVVGWSSHLVGDFVFGAASQYRGAGIPWWPWWGHEGVGLKSGGRIERFVAAPLIVLGMLWMAWVGLAVPVLAVVR